MSAVDAGLGGCGWRRCSHPATVVVSFQVPHPLAGTSRGYCAVHAAHVGGQPGAVLTGTVGRVPVQQALPGVAGPAQDAGAAGQRPPWGGGR